MWFGGNASRLHHPQPCRTSRRPRAAVSRERSSSPAPARTTSKGVDLTLPHRKLIVFTGVSGSGKSSLAFDTIYAEGQRRYVESLSAYARQFLERMEKPDVDAIDGIAPAIAIRQKNSHPQSRGRPSARRPRFTTTCGCSGPASAAPSAGSAATKSSASRRRSWPSTAAGPARGHAPADRLRVPHRGRSVTSPARAGLRRRGGRADRRRRRLTASRSRPDGPATPIAASADRPLLATSTRLRRRGFGRLLVGGRTVTLDERGARPERARAAPRRCPSSSTASGSAPDAADAGDRFDRDLVSRRRRRRVRGRGRRERRANGARIGSANASSAARAAFPTRCRSRVCSRSTTRSARARRATASATSSSSIMNLVVPDASQVDQRGRDRAVDQAALRGRRWPH